MGRICLIATALLACALPARADDGVVIIYVAPLGSVPTDVLDEMSYSLRKEYAAEVVLLDPVALPRTDAQSGRHQRAEKLLDLLDERLPADPRPGARILGVTTADVWAAKGGKPARSVFGLGRRWGPSAVISTHRLRQGARDRAQFTFRVGSAAIHQLGHTFGLGHCEEARCAMLDDSVGLQNTDTGDGHLGRQCRDQLATVPQPR